jgi:hypothetical protein
MVRTIRLGTRINFPNQLRRSRSHGLLHGVLSLCHWGGKNTGLCIMRCRLLYPLPPIQGDVAYFWRCLRRWLMRHPSYRKMLKRRSSSWVCTPAQKHLHFSLERRQVHCGYGACACGRAYRPAGPGRGPVLRACWQKSPYARRHGPDRIICLNDQSGARKYAIRA